MLFPIGSWLVRNSIICDKYLNIGKKKYHIFTTIYYVSSVKLIWVEVRR